MKRFTLVLALAALTACQDSIPSAPALSASNTSNRLLSLAPPPPRDLLADFTAEGTTVPIAVTYFLNRTGNNGWISFSDTQAEGVSASPNARISYHRGTFSGKGTLTFPNAFGQPVTVDLSSVNQQGSFFTDCDAGCFGLHFDNATVSNGEGGTRQVQGGVTVRPEFKQVIGDIAG